MSEKELFSEEVVDRILSSTAIAEAMERFREKTKAEIIEEITPNLDKIMEKVEFINGECTQIQGSINVLTTKLDGINTNLTTKINGVDTRVNDLKDSSNRWFTVLGLIFSVSAIIVPILAAIFGK